MLAAMPTVSAQNREAVSSGNYVDSVSVAFGPVQWDIDRNLGHNAAVLDSIHARLTTVCNDSLYRLQHVTVVGGLAPDGTLKTNTELTQRRTEAIFDWLGKYSNLSDTDRTFILLPYEKNALGVVITYDRIPAHEVEPQPADTITGKPFYMNVRSNMLYDALALPNIGAEFYLGKNFSVGANWLYGWWNSARRFHYWRAYGGELNGRWWVGKAASNKPLTGHHLGVYGQLYTYDFQWGHKGEMGGEPGDNLWNRFFWGAGVEYGYSLPVARRINIDFTLGLGYTTGTYYKYRPLEGHNVWLSTHKRHYWGPTKLEIAFVWLIGNGNFNQKKGGKQ